MGALVAIAAVILALVGAARTKGPRRRWLALVPAALGAIGLVAGIAAFVAAGTGDTGDMDPAGVVVLGILYLACGAGLGVLAHRLAFRR